MGHQRCEEVGEIDEVGSSVDYDESHYWVAVRHQLSLITDSVQSGYRSMQGILVPADARVLLAGR